MLETTLQTLSKTLPILSLIKQEHCRHRRPVSQLLHRYPTMGLARRLLLALLLAQLLRRLLWWLQQERVVAARLGMARLAQKLPMWEQVPPLPAMSTVFNLTSNRPWMTNSSSARVSL